MYHKRQKKQRNIIIFISSIVIFLLLSVSLYFSHKDNIIESYLKDICMVVEKIVMYPFTTLNKEKGEDLSKSYVIQKNVNQSLENEIQELKNALELKETLTEYDSITTTVLSRNKSYWFNTVTIDKGK